MTGLSLELTALHRALTKAHGVAASDGYPTTAFEWVMWDVVPYAPDPEYRRGIYHRLRDEIGMTPDEIANAAPRTIAALAGKNPRAAIFGARARDVAARVRDDLGGDLDAAVRTAYRTSPRSARKLLQTFPGIGEPAADRILAFLELDVQVPLDASGVRVISRLAGIGAARSYGAQYSQARAAVSAAGAATPTRARELHFLLQAHGRALCRATPECGLCPLRAQCAHGARG